MTSVEPKRARGRPRLPEEAQRQRLFEAAVAAVEKHGYEYTRIADIVREAGMSSRSFYELFSSKEDLVAQYVERAAAALVSDLKVVWAETDDPLDRIDRGVQTFLRMLPAIRVDLDSIGGEAGLRARDARKNTVREITRLVVVDLERAFRAGRLATPPDAMAVELVMTGFETMALRYFAEGRSGELERLRPGFGRLLVQAGLSPAK